MTFPILGGNGAVAGYSIDNSLRLNQGDTPHLDKTFSSAGTSNKIGTLSFWYKRTTVGNVEFLFHVYPNRSGHSNDRTFVAIGSDNKLVYERIFEGSTQSQIKTTQLFRDVSAWYHFTIVFDTTQSTASDRLKIYLNGNQITDFSTTNYPAQNLDIDLADAHLHTVGAGYNGSYIHPTDGYLAEYHYIDGQALSPTDFGEFDTDSGIWKPIEYTGSYGTNGFYLDFENSGSLGTDQSGNGNDFSATNLASTDQTTDTPTNNFATLSSIDTHTTSPTLAEGNLDFTGVSGTAFTPARSTMAVSSGKWYMEYKFKTAGGGVGVMTTQSPINDHLRDDSDVRSLYRGHGGYYFGRNNSGAIDDVGDNSQTFSADDIGMIALDLDNGYVYFGKNGTWLYGQDGSTTGVPTSGSSGTGSANHSTQLLTNQHDGVWGFMAYDISTATTGRVIANFGNPPYTPASAVSDANGYGNFEYAPPSGYLALCTQNLATELSPTIDDGSEYFNTVLYSGNGSTQSITGVGFQPDFLWIKSRTTTDYHGLFDSNRGSTKRLFANDPAVESTQTAGVTSFDSDGFSLGSNLGQNRSSANFVAWNWLSNGGTTTSFSESGSNPGGTYQANTTSGFSIITYTGTGSAGTFPHGLGKRPKFIIFKGRTAAERPWVPSELITGNANGGLLLDRTDAEYTLGTTNVDASQIDSTNIAVKTSGNVNTDGIDYVCWAWAEIEGYSKFGTYTGNGNADGVFVYTGFRPAFVIIRRINNTQNWFLQDNKRNSNYNPNKKTLFPNLSNVEDGAIPIDHLSNGFKTRSTDTVTNNSGDTYIYIAFAESPFVSSSGVPVVAR